MGVRENCRSDLGAVDVHPEIVTPAAVGDRDHVVHRAGIRSPRGGDDTEWLFACAKVACDLLFEYLRIELNFLVDVDSSQSTAADSEEASRFVDRMVSLGG